MRRTLPLLVLSLICLRHPGAQAQPLKPGEWRTYTSMRGVHALAIGPDSNHVWAATTGGAFSVSLLDDAEPIRALRTTDGLAENNLTAIASDGAGHMFFGGANGSFDIFDQNSGKFTHQTDIHTDLRILNKTINNLEAVGGRVYISGAFGLSVYANTSPGYFITTVTHFASLPDQDSVMQAIEQGGYVYAVLSEGLVYAKRDANLNDFSVWTLIPTPAPGRALATYHGAILVGTTKGLYRLAGDSHTLDSLSVPGPPNIHQLIVAGDSLHILDYSGLLSSTNDLTNYSTRDLSAIFGTQVIAATIGRHAELAIGSDARGIALLSGNTLRLDLFPAGPVSNEVFDATFSPATGALYVANGFRGLSYFDPSSEQWISYPSGSGTTPGASFLNILYDSTRQITWASADGIYAATGFGTPKPVWIKYTPLHGGLPSFEDPPTDFMIAGQGILDRDRNFVFTTWAHNGEGLSLTSDGVTFKSFAVADWRPYGVVTQDLSGNYWLGTESHSSPATYGVYWVRASDGAHGSLPGGPGLSILSPTVNAMITDQDNGIWCGTEQGVNIIGNPDAILSDANPRFSIRSVKLLEQQIVHSIVVDGVGNKWVGTENGIFVVSPDGADSVAHYSHENSPLVDNFIVRLAIDAARGEVYAATPSGISRFSTIFKQGNPDFSSMRVFPNPVIQTAESSPTVYIDGLVSGSTVKIVTLNGKMVATINGSNLGSTVRWNGRDDAGHALPSGLYLVSATSPQSGDNGEAKIVIVRTP